jgi:hypothetical protein
MNTFLNKWKYIEIWGSYAAIWVHGICTWEISKLVNALHEMDRLDE